MVEWNEAREASYIESELDRDSEWIQQDETYGWCFSPGKKWKYSNTRHPEMWPKLQNI